MNIKSFRVIGMTQWWWLCVAYWRLVVVKIRLKFGRQAKRQRWLNSKLQTVPASHAQPCSVLQQTDNLRKPIAMHESVRLAARLHFFELACLPKSIVLADMLRVRNYRATVMLGVSKQNTRFLSHAWVEVDGQMIAEPENVASDFVTVDVPIQS